MVGKYIDVSIILLFARIGRSDQGSASVHGGVVHCATIREMELLGSREESPYDTRVVPLVGGRVGAVGHFFIVLIHFWQDLDTSQQKTHLAVTLALGEISIVESCVAGWDDLTAIGQFRQNRHC